MVIILSWTILLTHSRIGLPTNLYFKGQNLLCFFCSCPLLGFEITLFVLHFEIILTGSLIPYSQDLIVKEFRLRLKPVQTVQSAQSQAVKSM